VTYYLPDERWREGGRGWRENLRENLK